MPTMMEHPKHGKHPATGHEVEHMKSLGWTICPPKAKEAAQSAEVAPVADSTDVPVIEPPAPAPTLPAPKRRGPNKAKAK